MHRNVPSVENIALVDEKSAHEELPDAGGE